jgi:hypothetical protein
MASRAAELTALVFNNRLIAETIAPELLADLLNYHVERRDQGQVLRVASLLPAPSARKGEAGIEVMIALYRRLNWNPEVQAAALEGLRRYVRRLSDASAAPTINRLGRELGDSVRTALEATLLLHRLMGGEQIGDYAYTLHTVAQFLYDTGAAYRDKTTLPTISGLLSDMDSLSNDERRALGAGMLELMAHVAQLGVNHRAVRGSRENAEQVEALLQGRESAVTVLDIFRAMGGYFARGKRLPLKINRLLAASLRAVPEDRKSAVPAAALQGDLESLFSELSLQERRSLVRDLAIDLQRIADLTLMITERYDPRVLQDDSGLSRKLDSARQRPENTFEFYRFVHGYFVQRAR